MTVPKDQQAFHYFFIFLLDFQKQSPRPYKRPSNPSVLQYIISHFSLFLPFPPLTATATPSMSACQALVRRSYPEGADWFSPNPLTDADSDSDGYSDSESESDVPSLVGIKRLCGFTPFLSF